MEGRPAVPVVFGERSAVMGRKVISKTLWDGSAADSELGIIRHGVFVMGGHW